jgi:5,10-methylenetetrahydromethanopterin reductase
MQISCAFPTSLATPGHVGIAEELGYHRAWLYDTPQQSPDVWMVLGLAAARTTRIGLGPGVLVPSLRHPMVNAAGTAGLVALAPGRVAVGFGTGFTGRRAMGYGSLAWSALFRYVDAYLGLLRGDTIEWEGARMRMLHPDGHAPPRPIEVPVIVSAFGPKGVELTRARGFGLFGAPGGFTPGSFAWVASMTFGTVRDEGDEPGNDRELGAAGPGWALNYHLAYEFGGPDAVAALPGGAAWVAAAGEHTERDRHLAIHRNHLLAINDIDRAAWDAGGSTALDQLTVTGTAAQVRAKIEQAAEAGVTEIVYQPAGPEITRELERFIATATG